jgi:hypothetical protein
MIRNIDIFGDLALNKRKGRLLGRNISGRKCLPASQQSLTLHHHVDYDNSKKLLSHRTYRSLAQMYMLEFDLYLWVRKLWRNWRRVRPLISPRDKIDQDSIRISDSTRARSIVSLRLKWELKSIPSLHVRFYLSPSPSSPLAILHRSAPGLHLLCVTQSYAAILLEFNPLLCLKWYLETENWWVTVFPFFSILGYMWWKVF